MPTNKLIPAKFFIENEAGVKSFDGFHDPKITWNGFAVPHFTFEQATQVMNAVFPEKFENGIRERYWELNKSADFVGVDGMFDAIFPGAEIEGKELWPIGGFLWTWEVVS